MNRIAKNYLLDLMYELITIIVPLFTAPYLTRVLHANNYGIYNYVQSIGAIIISLSLLGIYSYGNRQVAYVRDNRESLSQTFWEILVLRFCLGFIGTMVYIGFAYIHSEYTVYFFMYYAYFLSNIIDCSWVFVGMENMLPCVLKNIAAKVITLIGVFLFVKTENDVGKYILLVAVGSLLGNISVYGQLKGIIHKPVINFKNILLHLKGSCVLFLPQVASLLYLQMDKAMIEWLTGQTSQISYYDQAEKIVTIALSIITALGTVMMPRIANEFKKGNSKQVEYYIIKAGVFSLSLAFPLMIGLICISKDFIPWYLGEDYNATAIAIKIISPIVVSNTLLSISGKQYFTATNKIFTLTISNTIAAVSNIIINAILIPKYGYIGAAIATLIASFLNVAFQYYHMNKTIKIRRMLNPSLKYLFFSIIMGGSVIIFTFLLRLGATFSTTIIQCIIGLLSYSVLLILSKDEYMKALILQISSTVRKLKH